MDKDRSIERSDGIDGIVKWGGRHSVPILLDILEEDYSPIQNEAYEALGKLKDARAALPVALRLEDARERRAAARCLDAMGGVAEEGLIVAVHSEDPKVALTAIRLLQEHGSDHCISILRKMVSGKNPQVREAAKVAIRCIRDRN
jgi:HEAT repeat protein